jgi:c-di-GMP-binding flagellar brake protein YcgR
VRQDRRRSKRVSAQQPVSITLGNGGGVVTATTDNVSSGGALFYCDRFISPGSDVALVIALPLELTHTKPIHRWCSGKVVRVEKELKDGKFGIAIEFTTFQMLPSA